MPRPRKKAELNCDDVAKLLHKAPMFVRMGLRQDRFPFGTAIQKPNGKWTYVIIPNKVYEYLGIKKKGDKNNVIFNNYDTTMYD